MDINSPNVQAYLYQLNKSTGSNPDAQVSMHDVGEALGLDQEEAAQMAEILLVGGHAELKTLSGGIGITPTGMDALGVTPAPDPAPKVRCLSGELVVTDQDRGIIENFLAEIKSALASGTGEYHVIETVVVDIKTIEVQLLSPVPKTAVVREVFLSMARALPEKECGSLIGRIKAAAGQAG